MNPGMINFVKQIIYLHCKELPLSVLVLEVWTFLYHVLLE